MNQDRLTKLANRRLDPDVHIKEANEVYKRLQQEPSIRYAIGAMQPIDQAYTKITFEQCDRVQNQLVRAYEQEGLKPSFNHQGSTTNDTHIKAHSDIDLLTISEESFAVEPPNKPQTPYKGDPVSDLRQLRKIAISRMSSSFPEADIDSQGAKSVSIEGGSLRRKVDVVFCNKWHTVDYVEKKEEIWMGIQILDNDKDIRVANKPYLHNAWIDYQDKQSNGGLRKTVRLWKSLKYDTEKIDLSSYDICALAFNMPLEDLLYASGHDLRLIKNGQKYLRFLVSSPENRNNLMVPNKTRKIFCDEGASLKGLAQLSNEVDLLVGEIEASLSRTFTKLAEARIDY